MTTWTEDSRYVLRLPDGAVVRGRGLRYGLPSGPTPDFGVYLLATPPEDLEWPFRWIDCPDFRCPRYTAAALDALTEAHGRSHGERVEVACGGGVGRTGLALATLAVMAGVAPREAVGWVRRRYHPRAVETPWQRRWVRRLEPPRPRSV